MPLPDVWGVVVQSQKALLEDMIVEEDKIGGLELVDTKVFK